MKKKLIIIVILIAVTAVMFAVPGAKSRIQPYYSGEAIGHQGRAVFGTVDTGWFELFITENGRITRKNFLAADDPAHRGFIDLVFREENRDLYVYLTNGLYVYKYRIANFASLELVKKVKDNSGDFFYALSDIDNGLATAGVKGFKAWTKDLEVIDLQNLHNTIASNMKFSPNRNYVYYIFRDSFKIIDAFYRYAILETSIRIRDDHARNIYREAVSGAVYLVDDYSLVKFFLNGEFRKFDHISHVGYDVDGVAGSEYVYFSDGIGIVKNRKSDLEPVAWVYTTKLGPGQGWSVGLRAVRDSGGEKVVVFNGDSILLFDENLVLLDYYAARDLPAPAPLPITLTADKYRGAPGSGISLRGIGFGAAEDLIIDFGPFQSYAKALPDGSFSRILNVPAIASGHTDIKVSGLVSGLTYSISFMIE